ncbi:MAG: DUF4258 domain-containing protein [Planctomycetota bacterium]|jgi:hypothetical protein
MIESKHFTEMLKERNIPSKIVDDVIDNPDRVESNEDGTKHYIKKIDDRWLRIIVNTGKTPPVKVTAFFDRRLRRLENEN